MDSLSSPVKIRRKWNRLLHSDKWHVMAVTDLMSTNVPLILPLISCKGRGYMGVGWEGWGVRRAGVDVGRLTSCSREIGSLSAHR